MLNLLKELSWDLWNKIVYINIIFFFIVLLDEFIIWLQM